MPTRLRALTGGLILLAISPLEAANPAAEDRSLEVLESGVATVSFEGRTRPLSFSQTLAGPLFALQSLAPSLGGSQLTVGPVDLRHELRIGDASFLFGPGSIAMTEGREIKILSQAPVMGAGGLHVPLDLLEALYGNLLGFDFSWTPTERLLTIDQRPLRELPVTLDVVHLQGVTTLVFEFPERPRYHIKKSARAIDIGLIGDRLNASSSREFSADEFVRDVRMTAQSIRIELGSRVVAQDYVLEHPFRIVLDVLRDRSGGAVAAPTSSPRQRAQRGGIRTVILDPGHGGSDPGAGGAGGKSVLEKELTLELARQLKNRLEQTLNLRVVLTRGTDTDLSLDSRSALANQYKGDLLISLHLNSSPNTSARGAETYFSSFDPSDEQAELSASFENAGSADPLYDLQLMLWDLAQSRYLGQSQSLAGLVQAEFNDALGLRDRGVKQAPFRVLQGAAMPAVLVEFGFLSNPSERTRLQDAGYRTELIESLVRAVSRYKAMNEQSAAPLPEFSSR